MSPPDAELIGVGVSDETEALLLRGSIVRTDLLPIAAEFLRQERLGIRARNKDRNGYVVFATEKDYCTCSHLRIGEKVNVPGGIWSMPGYVKADDPVS